MQPTLSIEKFKAGFFDRKAVQAAVGKATARNLSRGGSFVRRRAQTSMKYRKKGGSPPGSPPYAHREGKGPLLRKFLFFAWDPMAKSVVIGPAALPGPVEAPNLNEFGGKAKRIRAVREVTGGRATRNQRREFLKKIQTGEITRPKAPQKVVMATYPQRPFMGPALRQEVARGTILNVWKNSIKGG